MLTHANKDALLQRLDEELTKVGEPRTLIICGGGALLVMNLTARRTRDIDVISPIIDPVLKEIAKRVANEFSLAENWLNDNPSSLASDLEAGWQSRAVPIFKGTSLELRALGREDLLATKLYAFCDREDDFDDVVNLKPSKEELQKLFSWVLSRDGSSLWPQRVEDCFTRLRKKLNYG